MKNDKVMRAGPVHDKMKLYHFQPQEKVVQIDVIQHKVTKGIGQIVFHGPNGVLVKVGNDAAVTGVTQVLKISADEELICARLEHIGGDSDDLDDFGIEIGDRLSGVTFIKATTK